MIAPYRVFQNLATDHQVAGLFTTLREGAHNALLDLEELEERELDRIRTSYGRLAKEARAELRRGGADTDAPPVE